eukprot:3440136-Pyramimonas_sp.AAC.1
MHTHHPRNHCVPLFVHGLRLASGVPAAARDLIAPLQWTCTDEGPEVSQAACSLLSCKPPCRTAVPLRQDAGPLAGFHVTLGFRRLRQTGRPGQRERVV